MSPRRFRPCRSERPQRRLLFNLPWQTCVFARSANSHPVQEARKVGITSGLVKRKPALHDDFAKDGVGTPQDSVLITSRSKSATQFLVRPSGDSMI